jgi:hypothetical protein
MIRECFPFLYKLRLFGNKHCEANCDSSNHGDISKLICIRAKDIDSTFNKSIKSIDTLESAVADADADADAVADADADAVTALSAESYNSNIIIIRYNSSNASNDNNDSNISDIIEIQDSLIGNRKWIKQFKSANDNYKHINKDIVRKYSSLSSTSLSSLEDNFDNSSKDIFRVSIDNVSGPIIQKIKKAASNPTS